MRNAKLHWYSKEAVNEKSRSQGNARYRADRSVLVSAWGAALKSIRINLKIVIILVILLLLSLVLCVVWSNYSQNTQAEREMLEKSRIMAKQMSASWEFIEVNQARIDTDSDGSYNFKGIYCAIAGKSIAALFARGTDYEIRYVSTTPRKSGALPDDFEADALEQFAATGSNEYYGASVLDGKDVFRYVMPVYIEESCLECHGEPAGETDITGYSKEGHAIGDIGGAISIAMPVELYLSGIHNNITLQIIYFAVIILILVTIVYIAIAKLITKPLAKLETAAKQIESGNLDVNVGDVRATGEIADLARRFDLMTTQLKSSYETLENQVRERTLQLEQTNKRLRDESEYKSDFLAIVSHELRTPLTSIIAFTEIWEKSATQGSERDRAALSEIKENGQLLLQMVNNILESARIEEGRSELHLEPVDFVDLISTVRSTIAFIAEKRDIDLSTVVHPDVPIINADWEKIRRIVDNLASNAIKFTQRGGSVRIEVSFDEAGHSVLISVFDTGIGIKPEELPYIFDRFMQVDKSSHRRYGGSGLGLAVVRDLVEMHDGAIKVNSVYKRGSTFTARIPVGDPGCALVEGDVCDEDSTCR